MMLPSQSSAMLNHLQTSSISLYALAAYTLPCSLVDPHAMDTFTDNPSSLTWGILQERITTTNYGTDSNREVFRYPVVMNTVQSLFAATLGYTYVLISRKSSSDLPIIPSTKILWPLLLVAGTSALSSPFGYSSLAHVDYITFILAKSCKLLPVMFLHVTLYGKRYPFYKYAVVVLVTAGVAIFTLHQSSGSKKKKGADGNSAYGLMLLSINLMLDGLTNSTQDDIYARFRPYTGQHMMCALNVMSTCITTAYLLLSPYIAQTGIGHYVGMESNNSAGELQEALAFIQRHPNVGYDILGFAFCGAMGQVFICKSCCTPQEIRWALTCLCSPHPVPLRLSAASHGHRDAEDAHHDTFGPVLRSQPHRHAMAGRRSCLRWDWH